VRQLIASGTAKPNEIAIASASTAAWDDHFLSCAEGAGFRLHTRMRRYHAPPRQPGAFSVARFRVDCTINMAGFDLR